MNVVAFVRPEPDRDVAPAGAPGREVASEAEARLRLYGLAMKFCFMVVLASWVALQIGCVLSLFLHFRSGIVVGTIDGSIAFRFWAPIDYLAPAHALAREFSPKVFPVSVSIAFTMILAVASVPFCASLSYLAQLFALYSRGKAFTRRNATVMRRLGHSIMATGYSPFLLGPIAHMIGVLRPVTGLTDKMIAFVFLGLILLAISHATEIGQRMQQDQEAIL